MKIGFEDSLGHLRPRTSNQVQTLAVHNLVERVLGNDSQYFEVEVKKEILDSLAEKKDTFAVR